MNRIIPRLLILIAATLLIHQVFQSESRACNIAVISAAESATGRPFIWKNRDHAGSYRHEVLYYAEPADEDKIELDGKIVTGIGGSVRLMGETTYDTNVSVCTGGANESGFAITNTTCVDGDNDPFDISNVNTELMEKALENCKTLAQFENLLSNFTSIWLNKNISGIFAVIDAQGGAAIYEMWTDGNNNDIMFRKFNVDTGAVTDESGEIFTDIKFEQTTGFINRTNSNHTNGWIDIWTDDPRELRGRQLLSQMKDDSALTPRNVMRYLSKDVLGGNTATYCTSENVQNCWDWSVDSWDNPNYAGELYTRFAISRYQTSMGLVIEGAATAEQAKLTTMWVALGEPSLSVFIPYFPYAQTISKYATDDAHTNDGYYWDGVSDSQDNKANSYLNLLFDCIQANPFGTSHELYDTYKAISLYDNNGSGLGGGSNDAQSARYTGSWTQKLGDYMDNTINYPRLVSLQQWTFPLENILFDNTRDLISVLLENPELVTRELLADYSEYCNGFVYKNYSNQSATFVSWNYELPEGAEPDTTDPDSDDWTPPADNDGDQDDDTDNDNNDPGDTDSGDVKTASTSGGCGFSAEASAGRTGDANGLAGLISLLVTMLFPLGLILIRRVYMKRRD